MPEPNPPAEVSRRHARATLLSLLRRELYEIGTFPQLPSEVETYHYAVEQLAQLLLSPEHVALFVWRAGRLFGMADPPLAQGKEGKE